MRAGGMVLEEYSRASAATFRLVSSHRDMHLSKSITLPLLVASTLRDLAEVTKITTLVTGKVTLSLLYPME